MTTEQLTWHPASAPPYMGVPVLVSIGVSINIDWLLAADDKRWAFSGASVAGTHWMPLPLPPAPQAPKEPK